MNGNAMKSYFENLIKKSKEDFLNEADNCLENSQKMFIITANPEIFMHGKTDKTVDKMLTDENVHIVADGIGIVKGGKMLGINIPERIPGVEIAEHLIKTANEKSKSVFFFGAKQEVLDALTKRLKNQYTNLKIAGAVNGYTENKDAVFGDIKSATPDIIFVALGVPLQEKLIYTHIDEFDKGIFVGIGGTLDVLSGTKKRAPEFFINHNLEWLYRIVKEPSRLKRFYNNNVKFILSVKKEAKRTNKNEN